MQSDFVLFSICYDCTVCQKLKMEPKVALRYIDRQGFIEGGAGIPPPPEILKLSMVVIVLSQVLNNNLVPDCVRSNLRGSKIQNFSRGACPQTPLVGTHPYVCVSVLSRATITLLSSCFPPTQNPV